MEMKKDLWQPLPWSGWRETALTVHLFTQIIGKIRLALMPMQAEWAQVPFTVTASGISSIGMPITAGSMDIAFDFINHKINFCSSSGKIISFSLKDKSVAVFYKEVMKALKELDVEVHINPVSVEMKTAIKMDTDEEHRTYDGEAVRSWWHLLIPVGNVFNEFRSRFWGKETPASFYWGTFDLSVTLFSGKPASAPPGADLISRVGMDAEQFEAGFWPGDDESPEPVFFAYIFPKPDGLENEIIAPDTAKWSAEKGEFILPYEAIRNGDTAKLLMEFCKSTFHAGAKLGGWDLKRLEYK